MPRPVPGPTEVLVRHDRVGDLAGHRARRHGAGPVQPAGQGPGPARPGPPGGAQGPDRGAGRDRARRCAGGWPRTCRSATRPRARSSRSARAVAGIRPGQLVATGGAGKANHARVPGRARAAVRGDPRRACRPPDAAFTTVASIALHGLRLAEAGPGSKVVVIGLGLVGQLAARLAMAAGCDVAGIDPAPHAARGRGRRAACWRWTSSATRRPGRCWTGPAAAARTRCWSARRAGRRSRCCGRPALCRDRAPVVVVGDIGLELDRTPFYEKELSLRFARSYGPGRYDAVV